MLGKRGDGLFHLVGENFDDDVFFDLREVGGIAPAVASDEGGVDKFAEGLGGRLDSVTQVQDFVDDAVWRQSISHAIH